jgi:hypothetical protein
MPPRLLAAGALLAWLTAGGSGCEVFVPEVGGEGQPCADSQDQPCRDPTLVCAEGTCCRPSDSPATSCSGDLARVLVDDGCGPLRTQATCDSSCRACRVGTDGVATCAPLAEGIHEGCSQDSRRRLRLDGCGVEFEEVETCPEHAACQVQPGGQATSCACLEHWTGATCDTCPEHFDAACTACLGDWDLTTECAGCLANRDPTTDCATCLAHYSQASGCSQCEGSWDPDQGCAACLGGYDPATDCTTCLAHFSLASGCSQCEGNWDLAQGCTTCQAHFDETTGCATCTDLWTGPGCDVCPSTVMLPGCAACIPGFEGAACEQPYCDTHDCWTLPPTGQIVCYDETGPATCPGTAGDAACGATALCGQDAQYPDRAREQLAFRRGTERMLFDSATGLTWQVDFSTQSWPTVAEAAAHCEDLSYGGFDDWRPAAYHDWIGLMLYDRSDPAVDSLVFPTFGLDAWISSMPQAPGDETLSMCVHLASAHVQWCSGPKTFVCVRGGPQPLASPLTPSTVGGDDLLTDERTGLVWQADATYPAGGMTWQEALSHCEGLTYGQASDWRLPDVKELASVMDPSRRNPAALIPSLDPAWSLWTSTTKYADPVAAFVICLARTHTSGDAWKTWRAAGGDCAGPLGALCVRGGR